MVKKIKTKTNKKNPISLRQTEIYGLRNLKGPEAG